MAAIIFAFTSGFLLIAGSTQIELTWLSIAQLVLGIVFLLSGAGAGWTWARKL